MPHLPWFVTALLLFFVGAWAATKWPSVNLIGKATGM